MATKAKAMKGAKRPPTRFKGRNWSPNQTVRRQVIVTKLKPQRTLWAFGYLDIAALLDLKPETVRWMVSQNRLDPGDLAALCKAWLKRHTDPSWSAANDANASLPPKYESA